jgi:hypothetical protein
MTKERVINARKVKTGKQVKRKSVGDKLTSYAGCLLAFYQILHTGSLPVLKPRIALDFIISRHPSPSCFQPMIQNMHVINHTYLLEQ